VALWLARWGAGREADIRRREEEERRAAAESALKYSLEHLVTMFEENDKNPTRTLKKASLTAKFNAALKGIDQALASPISDLNLLNDALNVYGVVR